MKRTGKRKKNQYRKHKNKKRFWEGSRTFPKPAEPEKREANWAGPIREGKTQGLRATVLRGDLRAI